MIHPIVQVTQCLQQKENGRNICPDDLLCDLKDNMQCCRRVFDAVVTTKAQCWRKMTMHVDQTESLFTTLLPKEIRQLCEEMDLRMYYFLCYGNDPVSPPFPQEWQDLLAFVPSPSCAEVDDLGSETWREESETKREQNQEEREQSLVMSFGKSSDRQAQMVSDWKQGKLHTGTFLDEWYAFFVDTLPVECLTHHRRLGQLFPTFTHLRLMGET